MATDITLRFEDPHDADYFLRCREVGVPVSVALLGRVSVIDIAGDTRQEDASGGRRV